MDTEASLVRILTTASFVPKARNAIIEFCCGSLTELANLPRSDLDSGVANLHKALSTIPNARDQVRLRASKILTLHAIRIHFLDRINCAALLNATEIGAITTDNINEMRDDYLESTRSQGSSSSLEPIKIPKLDNKNWPNFKSAIEEHFGRVLGRDKIPLSYVIRNNDTNDFNAVYETRKERLSSCLNHSGPDFKTDNGTVLSILVQYTKNTEGDSMVASVTKSRNGRKAWKNLLLHFEGSTYKERLAQEAGSILKNTSYNGPRRNFSFGDYYKRHALAHTKLDSANKPMTTEQKIDMFVQSMQCSTAQSIVVNIAGIATYRSTFDAYYNAVASRLELALSLTNKSSESETRNVNSVDQKKRKSTPKSDKNPRKKPFVPEDRNYSPSEWAVRTPDERKQIRALHRERKNKTPRFNRQPTYPPQNHQQNFPPQQSRAMVPYVPPAHGSQFSGRNISQQYQPYAYGSMANDGRMINSTALPPHPIGSIPPPPPLRCPEHGSLNVDQGEIGSYFGGAYNPS